MTDRWLILRTSGPRTLPLARSLQASGLEAWTPTAHVKRRALRGKNQGRRVDAPITPTFVFADAAALPRLQLAMADPRNPHPSFSIFRQRDRVVTVADGELTQLRHVEEAGQRKAKRDDAMSSHGTALPYPVGVELLFSAGPWIGLPALVLASDARITHLSFGSRFKVKVDTCQLRADGVAIAAAAA